MPRVIKVTLAGVLLAALAACSPAGSSPSDGVPQSAGGSPSSAPCASAAPGCVPPGSSASPGESAAAMPSFETGPTGTPIGDWSVTLTGGPSAGTYSGRDEIVCVTGAGLPTSVASNPVGSPPIGHFDMGTGGGGEDAIYVSAGGLEGGGNYQTSFGDAEVLEGPTVTDGILHLKMSGTDPFPGDPRTILLEVTCPLFPAEPTDG